jgi:hypothetical protein
LIPFFNRLQKRAFFKLLITPPSLIQALCTTNEIDNFSFGRLGLRHGRNMVGLKAKILDMFCIEVKFTGNHCFESNVPENEE